MRVATWNIRHGGAAGDGHRRVVGTLLGFDADVLVVTEFRTNDRGAAIVVALQQAGYYTTNPDSPPNRNSVLIASRTPITTTQSLASSLSDSWRLWMADLGWGRVTGVYMPNQERKLPYWDSVISAASGPSAPCLLIGDFNTGRNDLDKADNATALIGAEYMDRIGEVGLIDLWRSRHPDRREYSWFSTPWNNGFRLDHALGTSCIAAMVTDCRYDHAPRLERISDHSALIVELAVAGTAITAR